MDIEQIRAVVEEHAAEHHVPGIAWGVVRGGDLVARGSHGTLCVDEDDPPTTGSPFRIASMTKSFTAAAVLLLRDEGAVVLDEPAGRYVPELDALPGVTTDAPPVTVRHLLTMAAGWATDDAWADRHLDASPAELSAILAAGPTSADATGVRFEYSNTGYAALGRLIANVTGGPAQAFVRARLLEPLGMYSTGWTPPEGGAVGHHRQDDGWVVEPALADGEYAPMGGLWSTVEDLARWVGFFLDAFPPRDDADAGPLRRASRREMQQAQRCHPSEMEEGKDGRPARLVAGGYGMGLRILHELRHPYVVTHSGGLPGFGSNMRWLPDHGLGVVALGNVTYAPMAMLTVRLVDVLADQGELGDPRPASDHLVRPAAERLVALLSSWDDRSADDLFADNVALDDAYERRRAAATAVGGPLRLDGVRATSRTSATATVASGDTTWTLELQLSPQVPPRVQWYELTKVDSSPAEGT